MTDHKETKPLIDIRYWVAGIRLYIALGIGLVTVNVWWWAHAAYNGNVVAIRMQETYAWLSVGLLVSALTIGPLCKLLPQLPGKGLLFDARRLLGIGAAWFASLHVAIAYGVQFKYANPFLLPGNFKLAFALGTTALIILLAMTFTSFNRAMRSMGIWWFRLHRLVYAAGLLAMAHAFMIGVHATLIVPLAIITFMALLLIVLHISAALASRGQPNRPGRPVLWKIATIIVTGLLFVGIANYGLQQYLVHSGGVLGGLQGMEMHH